MFIPSKGSSHHKVMISGPKLEPRANYR